VPADSRAARADSTLPGDHLDATLGHVRRLNEIAAARGQKLAQLALQWALRDPRVTSAVIGASSVEQLEDSASAVSTLHFSDDELQQIDQHAVDAGIDLWRTQSELS
jgi:L-glyceraldehyde 3-phosphate reductase